MNNKVKNGIKDFIREINPMVQVKFQDLELEVDIDDEVIYVGKSVDKRADKYFMAFVKKINSKAEFINPALLSLLHELGHIETWTTEDREMKDFMFNVLKLSYEDVDIFATDELLKEYCFQYFNIPLEKNATEWAIDFALEHKDLLDKYNWLEI